MASRGVPAVSAQVGRPKLPAFIKTLPVNLRMAFSYYPNWRTGVLEGLKSLMFSYDPKLHGVPFRYQDVRVGQLAHAADSNTTFVAPVKATFWVLSPEVGHIFRATVVKLTAEGSLFVVCTVHSKFSARVSYAREKSEAEEAATVEVGDIIEFEYHGLNVTKKLVLMRGDFKRIVQKRSHDLRDSAKMENLWRELQSIGIQEMNTEMEGASQCNSASAPVVLADVNGVDLSKLEEEPEETAVVHAPESSFMDSVEAGCAASKLTCRSSARVSLNTSTEVSGRSQQDWVVKAPANFHSGSSDDEEGGLNRSGRLSMSEPIKTRTESRCERRSQTQLNKKRNVEWYESAGFTTEPKVVENESKNDASSSEDSADVAPCDREPPGNPPVPKTLPAVARARESASTPNDDGDVYRVDSKPAKHPKSRGAVPPSSRRTSGVSKSSERFEALLTSSEDEEPTAVESRKGSSPISSTRHAAEMAEEDGRKALRRKNRNEKPRNGKTDGKQIASSLTNFGDEAKSSEPRKAERTSEHSSTQESAVFGDVGDKNGPFQPLTQAVFRKSKVSEGTDSSGSESDDTQPLKRPSLSKHPFNKRRCLLGSASGASTPVMKQIAPQARRVSFISDGTTNQEDRGRVPHLSEASSVSPRVPPSPTKCKAVRDVGSSADAKVNSAVSSPKSRSALLRRTKEKERRSSFSEDSDGYTSNANEPRSAKNVFLGKELKQKSNFGRSEAAKETLAKASPSLPRAGTFGGTNQNRPTVPCDDSDDSDGEADESRPPANAAAARKRDTVAHPSQSPSASPRVPPSKSKKAPAMSALVSSNSDDDGPEENWSRPAKNMQPKTMLDIGKSVAVKNNSCKRPPTLSRPETAGERKSAERTSWSSGGADEEEFIDKPTKKTPSGGKSVAARQVAAECSASRESTKQWKGASSSSGESDDDDFVDEPTKTKSGEGKSAAAMKAPAKPSSSRESTKRKKKSSSMFGESDEDYVGDKPAMEVPHEAKSVAAKKTPAENGSSRESTTKRKQTSSSSGESDEDTVSEEPAKVIPGGRKSTSAKKTPAKPTESRERMKQTSSSSGESEDDDRRKKIPDEGKYAATKRTPAKPSESQERTKQTSSNSGESDEDDVVDARRRKIPGGGKAPVTKKTPAKLPSSRESDGKTKRVESSSDESDNRGEANILKTPKNKDQTALNSSSNSSPWLEELFSKLRASAEGLDEASGTAEIARILQASRTSFGTKGLRPDEGTPESFGANERRSRVGEVEEESGEDEIGSVSSRSSKAQMDRARKAFAKREKPVHASHSSGSDSEVEIPRQPFAPKRNEKGAIARARRSETESVTSPSVPKKKKHSEAGSRKTDDAPFIAEKQKLTTKEMGGTRKSNEDPVAWTKDVVAACSKTVDSTPSYPSNSESEGGKRGQTSGPERSETGAIARARKSETESVSSPSFRKKKEHRLTGSREPDGAPVIAEKSKSTSKEVGGARKSEKVIAAASTEEDAAKTTAMNCSNIVDPTDPKSESDVSKSRKRPREEIEESDGDVDAGHSSQEPDPSSKVAAWLRQSVHDRNEDENPKKKTTKGKSSEQWNPAGLVVPPPSLRVSKTPKKEEATPAKVNPDSSDTESEDTSSPLPRKRITPAKSKSTVRSRRGQKRPSRTPPAALPDDLKAYLTKFKDDSDSSDSEAETPPARKPVASKSSEKEKIENPADKLASAAFGDEVRAKSKSEGPTAKTEKTCDDRRRVLSNDGMARSRHAMTRKISRRFRLTGACTGIP